MKKTTYTLAISLLLLLSHCKSRETKNTNNCEAYMSGKIKLDTLNADSSHLSVKYINECNQVQKEVQLLRTTGDSLVKDGFQKRYYSNGKLNVAAFFRMGLRDSITTFYYPNGTMKAYEYYYEGDRYGKSIEYDTNGKPRTVKYYADNGKIMLETFLNKQNCVDSLNGELFFPIVFGDDNFKTGKPVSLAILVPEYETTATKSNVACLYKGERTFDTLITNYQHTLNTSIFFYTIAEPEYGDYKVNIDVSLYDKASNRLLKNSKGTITLEIR